MTAVLAILAAVLYVVTGIAALWLMISLGWTERGSNESEEAFGGALMVSVILWPFVLLLGSAIALAGAIGRRASR